MEDVEGIPWNVNPKDELRYKHLTNGLHMFMPLLGLTFHFCNIQYRLAKISTKVRVFMMHITRYNMDPGWGREPSMIKNRMLEVKRNVIKCKDIGKTPSYPSLGTHPVKDLLGMDPEVDMLMQILDPGRISKSAQFDTFKISRSDFSTVWKASIKGVV